MRAWRQLSIVGGTIGVLALGGGAALAHTVEAESKVTIRYKAEDERFQGQVKSDKPSCERRRTVVVYRRTPGEENPEVGSDKTNENGHWRVEVNAANGEYYARVLRRARTPDGHKHVCLADRSETVEVDSVPEQAGRPPA